ncbi:hypothetical protein DL95DRAFT_457086 [Leptodontidium sp. 2 PMI_412]|nr:hypothetical protein DL95DRAFT_457086 [Leptodontidium sp. 2 PMI_412]
MYSPSLLLSLVSLASAASHIARNCNSSTSYNTTLPGHFLPANITNRTFFNNSCTADTVSIRKEWRSLTHEEKLAFVNAELCLMALPNKTDLPGATTRFDDFQAAHQQGTNATYGDIIHYTCGLTDTYVGGNGSSINNCVTTGPFTNRTEYIGPLEQTTDYCFARKFNQTKGLAYGAEVNVDACYEYGGTDFESFYGCMAYLPHIAGHQATGGVMTDVDSSPGDPVFYLHHNYVDRLYWQWQQINATDTMYAISRNTTVTEPATGWKALTLDYELDMFGVADNAKMEDAMNIQGGFLCYAFEH